MTRSPAGRPPKVPGLLLRLLSNRHEEFVAGDLEEEFRERILPERGRVRADLWYWRHALASVGALSMHRALDPARAVGGFVMHVLTAATGLRRDPGFTVLSGGLLALGIGSFTSLYAVTSQVVLRPLPVHEQDRLVVAWSRSAARGVDHFPYFPGVFETARRDAPELEAVAATFSWGTSQLVLEEIDGTASILRSSPVLGDFFQVLGVDPVIGRVLDAEDQSPAAPVTAAVISEGLWTTRYARSSAAIGATLTSRVGTYTIVGVAPADFDYPHGAELWTPMRKLYGREGRLPALMELDLVLRLAGDASRASAAERLAAIQLSDPELERIYRDAEPVVRPFEDVVLGDLGGTLFLLLAGAALLLGIAAVNVANLVLVRAIGRREDQAIRRAIGASPEHLAKDALAEALLLALIAGLGGAIIARTAVELLIPVAPPGLPRMDGVTSLNAGAYSVAVGAGAVVVCLAVLLPLWRARLGDPAAELLGASRSSEGTGAKRARGAFVAAQTAITVWVLVVGGLLIRTAVKLQALEPGFPADELTLVALDYGTGDEPVRVSQIEEALELIESAPGVLGATHLLSEPLSGSASWRSRIFLEGQSTEEALDSSPYAFVQSVEPGFFDVLGQSILRGRPFRASDDAGAQPAVIVNATAARALWPGSDALGRRIRLPIVEHADTWWSVIGVVDDTRYDDLVEPQPALYFAVRQFSQWLPRQLLVRVESPGVPVLRLAREALAATAPPIVPTRATNVGSRLDEPLIRPRFAALIIGVFALVTLLMAAVGMYGVMAFLARSRRPEIGVRLACGASPLRVAGQLVGEGMVVTAAGAAAGAMAGVASGQVFEALLFEVSPYDPASVAMAVAITVSVALVACSGPIRRAVRVDVVAILRHD